MASALDCDLSANMRAVLLIALLILLPPEWRKAPTEESSLSHALEARASVGKGALYGGGRAGWRKFVRRRGEYGGGASGFGKRLGAGFGTNAVEGYRGARMRRACMKI